MTFTQPPHPGATHREVTDAVRQFYNTSPFPAFAPDKYPTEDTLRDRAGAYARMLDRQIPENAAVADIGCGTGQLAAFLSLRRTRTLTGVDLSAGSLRYARNLAAKLELDNLTLLEGNLFELPLPEESQDVVLCNGVLHHTADPEVGLSALTRIVRPGGYLVVGLYNTFGRTAHRALRALAHHSGATGERIAAWGVRRMLAGQWENTDSDKQKAWLADQFYHPHESTHTVDEVLRWFRQNGLTHTATLPPITADSAQLFPEDSPAERTSAWRTMALVRQIGWIWQLRATGGYFVMAARKPASRPSNVHTGR